MGNDNDLDDFGYDPDITTANPGNAKFQGGGSTGKEAKLQKSQSAETPMSSSVGGIADPGVNK